MEESDESETEIVDNSDRGKGKKGKKSPKFVTWKKAKKWKSPVSDDFESVSLEISEDYSDLGLDSNTEPYDLVKNLFLNDDFMGWIINQSRMYNTWRALNNKGRQVNHPSKDEVETVIGIIMYMGIVQLPQRRMYWSPKTRVDIIANAMAVNRFDEIISILHYNDNSSIPTDPKSPEYDRCYKISPLVTHFRHQFSNVVSKETCLAVDEQIIPFKGRHSLKRYCPKKPNKWGYKTWALAGISGYVYDFQLDGGLGTLGCPASLTDCPTEIKESGFIVLRLIENLQPNIHRIYFDNFFNSPDLLKYMGTKQLWGLGTLRKDRTRNCPIESEKALKQRGRGSSQEIVSTDGSVVVTPWYDNKRVIMASNFVGIEPMTQCRRYDKKKKEYMQVDRPASVTEYNKFMGGVDKSDMLLAIYRTRFKTQKWYHRLAFHMISQSVVNAWFIHKALCASVGNTPFTYLQFLSKVCESMISANNYVEISDDELFDPEPSKKIVRLEDVPEAKRYDRFDHWPMFMCDIQNAQRCKQLGCKRKTKYKCSKCKIWLCVSGPCFVEFHGIDY